MARGPFQVIPDSAKLHPPPPTPEWLPLDQPQSDVRCSLTPNTQPMMGWDTCYAQSHQKDRKWPPVVLNSSQVKRIHLRSSWPLPLTTNSSFMPHESQPMLAAQQSQHDSCQWGLESPKATFNLILFSTMSEKNSESSKELQHV